MPDLPDHAPNSPDPGHIPNFRPQSDSHHPDACQAGHGQGAPDETHASWYQTLADNVLTVLLFIRKSDGHILEANQAATQVYGYTRAELLQMTIHLLRTPDTIRLVEYHLQQVGRDGTRFETIHARKDGSTFPVEVTSYELTIGSEPMLCSLIRDISEEKAASANLHASEERFRKLFETMAQGVIYFDEHAKITSANPAAEAILGMTLDEMSAYPRSNPFKTIREDGSEFPIYEHPVMLARQTGQEIRGVVMGVYHPRLSSYRWILLNAVPRVSPGLRKPFQVFTTFEDVTQLHETKQAYRATNQMLNAVINASPLAVNAVDRNGNVILWSPAAERLLGWTAEEIVGHQLPFLSLPKSEVVYKQIDDALQGIAQTDIEDTRWHKDGTLIPVSLSTAPIYDAHGEMNGCMAILTDITERMQQEEQIRSLARFPNDSPNPVARIGRDGVILYGNSACKPLFHVWARKEGELIPEQYRDLVRSALANSRTSEIEVACGECIYTILFVPITECDYVNLYGFEITERKNAERALQESEERFRSIFEHSPIGIGLSDSQTGQVIKANQAIQTMLGMSESEFTKLSFYDFSHPEDREIERSLRRNLLAGKTNSYQVEKRFQHVDGHWVWVRANVSLIEGPGDQLNTVGIIEDITGSKLAAQKLQDQMEENLRRNEELEAIVTVTTRLRSTQSRPEMVAVVLEMATKILGAETASLALLKGNSMVFEAASGLVAPWQGRTLIQNNSQFWQVIRDGEPYFIQNCSQSGRRICVPPFEEGSDQLMACILAPLKSVNTSIGLLFLGYTSPRSFTDRERRLVTAITDVSGNALHRMDISENMEKLVSTRTRELETIYRVSAAVSVQPGLRIALQTSLDPVMEALEARLGVIVLLDETTNRLTVFAERGLTPPMRAFIEQHPEGRNLERWVLENKQPLILPDLSSDPAIRDLPIANIQYPFAAMPMRAGDRVVGVLGLGRPSGEAFDLEELTLLSFLADHIALIVENARLFQQAERTAILEERSRLARDLHDSVTQSLYSAMLFAEGGRRYADLGKLDQVREYLIQLGRVTQQALKEMRLMIFELRSPTLRLEGLERAIRHRLDSVEMRSGITANLDARGIPALPAPTEEALYRITVEALNNSLKHACARNVNIRIEAKSGKIKLSIRDDGGGFNWKEAVENGGLGLISMQERVAKLEGNIQFKSVPGGGTLIAVEIPIGSNEPESRTGK